MNFFDLQTCVQRAINTLYARDFKLIELKTERALSHRFAVYLELEIPGWNVDCEYHRQGTDFELKHNLEASGATKNTRPDIVLHHRGEYSLEHNLLVVELKIEEIADDEKVREFTRSPSTGDKRKFRYQYGLALLFDPVITPRWYENGKSRTDIHRPANVQRGMAKGDH
jgi:hypothetical protein